MCFLLTEVNKPSLAHLTIWWKGEESAVWTRTWVWVMAHFLLCKLGSPSPAVLPRALGTISIKHLTWILALSGHWEQWLVGIPFLHISAMAAGSLGRTEACSKCLGPVKMFSSFRHSSTQISAFCNFPERVPHTGDCSLLIPEVNS